MTEMPKVGGFKSRGLRTLLGNPQLRRSEARRCQVSKGTLISNDWVKFHIQGFL